ISSLSLASGSEATGSRALSVSMRTAHIVRSSLTTDTDGSGHSSSELENLIVLQHARPKLTGVLLDFLHRKLDFAGLQMRNVDLRASLEFRELLGEHTRAKVFRNNRQLPFPVAKSGLDNQIFQVGDLVDRRPKRVVGRRVAGKHQTPLAGIELITDRRHDMVCRERREFALFQLDRIADLDFAVSKEGFLGTRDLREIRPDAPVEDVIAQDLERSRNRPKRERLVAHPSDGVDHERNARDVIEVRMCEKDVIDERELGERKVGNPRSGVDENVV